MNLINKKKIISNLQNTINKLSILSTSCKNIGLDKLATDIDKEINNIYKDIDVIIDSTLNT
jgi:hypothetical protein